MVDPADAPDPHDDEFWARYLETCRMNRVTPVFREHFKGMVQEWNEVLLGRPEPTQH